MRRLPVWVAMAVALTACTVSPGPVGQGSMELSGRYDGWRRVAIDGDLRGIVGLDSADPAPHLYALAVRLGKRCWST
jgi:hypothetical protein